VATIRFLYCQDCIASWHGSLGGLTTISRRVIELIIIKGKTHQSSHSVAYGAYMCVQEEAILYWCLEDHDLAIFGHNHSLCGFAEHREASEIRVVVCFFFCALLFANVLNRKSYEISKSEKMVICELLEEHLKTQEFLNDFSIRTDLIEVHIGSYSTL
jgi:hypothetical protein